MSLTSRGSWTVPWKSAVSPSAPHSKARGPLTRGSRATNSTWKPDRTRIEAREASGDLARGSTPWGPPSNARAREASRAKEKAQTRVAPAHGGAPRRSCGASVLQGGLILPCWQGASGFRIVAMSRHLILASASPRRRQLLAEVGYTFEVDPVRRRGARARSRSRPGGVRGPPRLEEGGGRRPPAPRRGGPRGRHGLRRRGADPRQAARSRRRRADDPAPGGARHRGPDRRLPPPRRSRRVGRGGRGQRRPVPAADRSRTRARSSTAGGGRGRRGPTASRTTTRSSRSRAGASRTSSACRWSGSPPCLRDYPSLTR